MIHFIYIGKCGVRGRCILMCLKEELAWTTDKKFWVISNRMLFKTVLALRK